MPVNNYLRNKIITWLEEGKPYSKIIELVKAEGGSISKGGISYIKKNIAPEEITKPETKPEEKTTIQEEIVPVKPEFKTAFELHRENLKKEFESSEANVKFSRLLTDLEFLTFENALNIIVNSNLIRLKKAKATGILNALNTLIDTCKMIKKRGKYQID